MKPHPFVLRSIYFVYPKTQEKQQSLRFAQSFLNDGTFIYRVLYTITNSVFTLLKIIIIIKNKTQLIKFHDTNKRQNNSCYYSIYKIRKTFKSIIAKIIPVVRALVKIVMSKQLVVINKMCLGRIIAYL